MPWSSVSYRHVPVPALPCPSLQVLELIKSACFLQVDGLLELACHRMCAHLLKQPLETLQQQLPRLWAAAIDGFGGFSCQLSPDGCRLLLTKQVTSCNDM